jgi:hypothetical protein
VAVKKVIPKGVQRMCTSTALRFLKYAKRLLIIVGSS